MMPARRTATGVLLAGLIAAAWLTIHIWAIFVHPWRLGDWPLAVVVIALQAWLSTGLFIVAHDAMHSSLVPGRPGWNRTLGKLCLAMYAGLSYDRALPKHHAHHRHSGLEGDPDFDTANPRHPIRWFATFFRRYYSHAQIVKITLAAIVYMLLGEARLLDIALFWAVPALLALGQLFVFGTYLPHRHEDAPFADRHNARSRRTSKLWSLLTCFHFGGYHHEHHLRPGVPWWALPGTVR